MTGLRSGSIVTAGMAALIVALASGASAQESPSPAAHDAATVAAGAKLFGANCAECHTVGKDGDQVSGPNLWGVVGAKAAAKPDFPYSEALTASGITWSEDKLDAWLTSPSTLVPGNMMGFIGFKNPDERKAVIAFLETRAAPE